MLSIDVKVNNEPIDTIRIVREFRIKDDLCAYRMTCDHGTEQLVHDRSMGWEALIVQALALHRSWFEESKTRHPSAMKGET